MKQVKSRGFNGNTSEITSCKPCVPVTAPSPQCPFVPATSLSAGRGANTRLRHCHQLPRIPKCLEKATAPSVSSALWSGRAWGEQGSVLQPTCGSSQPVTFCKRTCCVADTSTPVPTVCWVRVHSLQQVCGWTLRVKTVPAWLTASVSYCHWEPRHPATGPISAQPPAFLHPCFSPPPSPLSSDVQQVFSLFSCFCFCLTL